MKSKVVSEVVAAGVLMSLSGGGECIRFGSDRRHHITIPRMTVAYKVNRRYKWRHYRCTSPELDIFVPPVPNPEIP